jgi:tetrapyrrole methylase family protein/MazG family protein
MVKNITIISRVIQGRRKMKEDRNAGKKFERLVEIMDKLRSEQGCPWDREQDEKSISNYFLEEVYEAIEAITSKDAEILTEELGDVLMEVVFLARIYKEKRKFTITDVLEGINQKMIRRHPHVFGQKHIKTSERVLVEWQRQKKEEKERQSVLDGMSNSTPSLLAAFQIGLNVSSYGFDWKKPREALQKVKEEISELERALEGKKEDYIFRELGDIFFSMVNVSRLLGVNPEIALRDTNRKFIRRFRFIEERLNAKGKELGQATLEEMDEIWEEAKEKFE